MREERPSRGRLYAHEGPGIPGNKIGVLPQERGDADQSPKPWCLVHGTCSAPRGLHARKDMCVQECGSMHRVRSYGLGCA